jgi:nucleotide-binding universal stress UspA family protein
MQHLDAILCGVDHSDLSVRALAYAIKLAEAHSARLHVLEVSEPEAPEPDQNRLRDLVAAGSAAGVPIDVHVRQGSAGRVILAEAEALHAKLVVMGSHGRGGFERLMLGSVTSRVLHKATCPVLVVPPRAADDPDVAFDTIVCPTDFSSAGNTALAFARSVAAPSDHAHLYLLHVVEWPFGDATGEDAISDLRRSLETQAQGELEHLAAVQSLIEPAPDIQVVVAAGNPSREIIATARAHDADLIVMGVTGRGAIDLALLGSTTFQVVRHATCPVMTVPHVAS